LYCFVTRDADMTNHSSSVKFTKLVNKALMLTFIILISQLVFSKCKSND